MKKAFQLQKEFLIGVISDTHGLLRPEIIETFQSVDMIIHAGDIGSPEVLDALRAISLVVAVRGNMDNGKWALKLPQTEVIEIQKCMLYVIHDIHRLDLDPEAAGINCVISGHSHRPSVEERRGVLYMNPGSAGPQRFSMPVWVGLLRCHEASLDAQLVQLKG